MTILIAAFGIVLLGSFAQAVSGFGFALITVPLLAVTIDPRTAVVVTALTGIGLTLATAARERAYARWRTAGLLTAAGAVGVPAGLLVLALASDRVLAGLIAVDVLCCTVLVWRRIRMHAGPVAVGAVGVLAGALGVATGASGPPLVAAMQALGYDPRTFRATMAATFTGTGLLGLVGFLVTGQVTPAALETAAVALPAVALGWWLGNRLFAGIAPATFRRIVLIGLVASAATALGHTVLG